MPENAYNFWRRVQGQVNPAAFFRWFLAVNLPIAFLLQAFVTWHDSRIEFLTPADLLLRAVIALFAFGLGGVLVFLKVVHPAIQAVKKERDR